MLGAPELTNDILQRILTHFLNPNNNPFDSKGIKVT